MDVVHITRARSAIVGVLQGQLGPVRIQPGVFEHGVFAEMPVHKQQTQAKSCRARHWFDVRFGALDTNAASMASSIGSHAIDALAVEILCWTHKRNTIEEFQRVAVLDHIVADGDEARQALSYSRALETALDGEPTLIPSGIMHGPGVAGVPQKTDPVEDWEASLVRWSIVGALILHVPQTEPAF